MQSLLGSYSFVGFTELCQEIDVLPMCEVTITARNIGGKGKQRLLMEFTYDM